MNVAYWMLPCSFRKKKKGQSALIPVSFKIFGYHSKPFPL